ncbi:MAG: lipopolysaccharide biosynthesis protein, partial [Candidatus Binatia bacterium]
MARNAPLDLFRHSAVYATGEILGRLSSVLLLPVYTSYLRPADYGVIALLDVTTAILAILLGSGMSAAVARLHFDAATDSERREVWWTGTTFVAIAATVFLAPLFVLNETVARLALGSSIESGGFYVALALPTLWVSLVGRTPDAYLKVRKWSGIYVTISLAKLLLNIALNVSLLRLGLGVSGILLGNLIATGAATMTMLLLFARGVGGFGVSRALVPRLWRFGSPLVVTTLLALSLHSGDRYLLRAFLPMDDVGVYAIAYTLAQGVNTIVLAPFSSIWGVAMYEIASRPDARSVYARAFLYFGYVVLLLMLGVSLFARELLQVLVAADYLGAAELIPILCLAYVFFSLHEHFKVPAFLAKQTRALVPVFATAAATNVGVNLVLIPFFGTAGAALATLVAFIVFSVVAVQRYRRIDRYDYPFRTFALALFAMVGSYFTYELTRAAGVLDH